MISRIIPTLAVGLSLLGGSAGWSQSPPQSNGGGYNGALDQADQPPHSDSNASAHWWDRFSPPAAANRQATNGLPVPATQSGTASHLPFGKVFGRDDGKQQQSNPFAAQRPATEQPNSDPTVLVTEPDGSNPRDLISQPASGAYSSLNTGNSPIENTSKGCPYPDTGIQSSRPMSQCQPETNIADSAADSSQPPASVRGAFSGLLGREDTQTPQAARLPLLAPYKDLPIGYAQMATAARSAATESAASTKEKSVVGAAFNDSGTDKSNRKSVSAHATNNAPGAVTASNQTVAPQAFNLNGVNAGQLTGSPLNRPKIIYHPASSTIDSAGRKLIRPDVQVAIDPMSNETPSSVQLAQFAASEGPLPVPTNLAPETAFPIDDQQWMPPVVGDGQECPCYDGRNHGYHDGGWHGSRCGCSSDGVGAEHVMQAPFFIDTTQPFNNCRVRVDLARNVEFPDRSEFFWAKTPGGRGPGSALPGETSVNYQDLDFFIEKGFDRMSIATNLPIRAVDPQIRDDTAGFADMDVKTKLVFLNGKKWQLTQILDTILPTGSVHHGTGDGHVTMGPGVAYRYKWSDITYLHGDVKYYFPIGADPNFSGQFFNYGIGISHVLIDTDTYALIPTLEFEAWTFVDGRETIPNTVVSQEVNSIGIANICPGLRWVCDKGCDCGTKEFGISSGIALTSDHFYEEILRIEFRWSR